MFEIELKFDNRYWDNYFDTLFEQEKAIKLFKEVIKKYPEKQWRLVYKPRKEIKK